MDSKEKNGDIGMEKESLSNVADKLLQCVSKAADQLELYVTKNKHKVKTTEYDSETGKAQCEQSSEEETIGSAGGIIDRSELRHLVTALKDIKEIYERDSVGENKLEELIRGICENEE